MQKDVYKLEQQKLDNTIESIENNTYYIWKSLEKKKASIKSGNIMPGDDIAMRKGKEDLISNELAIAEPYFGKMDICSEDIGNETLYIGKQGVKDSDGDIVVVDWRMPITSAYYNFTPEQSIQTYEFDKEVETYKNTVEVFKKQSIEIEDKRIKKIIQEVAEGGNEENITITESGDSITVRDEILREVLENSETSGYLKEIIATIQKEQDKAIRRSIDRNLIIQGVAGSGKSSIALHRLSYLIYNYKKIDPEKYLIIGPSKLFINSVKDLLPELDLKGINQTTFSMMAIEKLKPLTKKMINQDYSFYFDEVLFKENKKTEYEVIKFKGSKKFVELIDNLINEIIEHYPKRFKDISISKEYLTVKELVEIYNGYKYLPFARRIERFLGHVKKHFKDLIDEQNRLLEENKDSIIKNYISGAGLSTDEFNTLHSLIEKVEKLKIETRKKELSSKFEEWSSNLKVPDLLEVYENSFELLASQGNGVNNVFKSYKLKKIDYFDLAPLYYMYLQFYENEKPYSHIVIDEAQDLSYMHYAALKKITSTMTIIGDKDQSIFMEYGQNDWEEIIDGHFNSEKEMILELQTSYRSTQEIIKVANGVLEQQLGMLFNTIIPFSRNGKDVVFYEVKHGEDLLNGIIDQINIWKTKYKRIAIIHKDEFRAKKLASRLADSLEDIHYLGLDDDIMTDSISVVASYNSKGMEFDAVILANINEENFPADDLHARLLYVLLTRAQQEVKVFYQNKPSTLISDQIENEEKEYALLNDIL